MIKVLFVCHGNICRSPIAEFILKKLLKEQGLEDSVYVESAATSTEELGNPVYPPARRVLAQHGISTNGKRARQITDRDYENFDYLILMEHYNRRNMNRVVRKAAEDPDGKISLLLDFTDHPGDISDPWFTGKFEEVYDEIETGCYGLLQHLYEAL